MTATLIYTFLLAFILLIKKKKGCKNRQSHTLITNYIFHILKTNSMKITYSIALFFMCLLNLDAQPIYEPSAEFFATGRFRAFYGQAVNNQPPTTKITNERSFNNTSIVDNEYIYAYVNCNQRRSILSNNRLNLDSFILVNGLITKHLRMSRTTLTAPFVTFSYDDYFYSNNRTKPDSILKYPVVDNKKSVRVFVYDPVNLTTTETFLDDSLGKRIFQNRNFTQFNTDGYIIKTLEEYFDLGNWQKYSEAFFTWQSGKLILHKSLFYDNTPRPDTIFLTPKYVGTTNRVDTFVETYKDMITGKILSGYARFINVSQNTKGYPTKVLFQTLNFTTYVYEPYQEWTYTYYPGDTLVRQKTTKRVGDNTLYLEKFEYCGIPSLTPISELQNLDFKIYPNPANQFINIEIPENMAFNDIPNTFGTEGPSVEIFNAMGIMVSKTKLLNIDVSGLPTGIYFAQVKSKDRVGVQRFMVNK
jgi:Secretion system C-terminal sorting domain